MSRASIFTDEDQVVLVHPSPYANRASSWFFPWSCRVLFVLRSRATRRRPRIVLGCVISIRYPTVINDWLIDAQPSSVLQFSNSHCVRNPSSAPPYSPTY